MYKSFYKTGIAEIPFGSDRLNKVLLELLDKNIKKGYEFKSKYTQSFDLRPDVINYDPVFVDVLKEFSIPDVIKKHTLKDMSLFHVQVRIVKNENSYMDWHRDTYYNQKGELIGKSPHGVKIIYYPQFKDGEKDRLLYLLGSNRIIFPNNTYDNQLFNILAVKKVKNSNKKAVLFDINGLHAVCPEKNKDTSIRLIYSFLSPQQIVDDHSNDMLHMNTMKMYESI